MHKAGSKMGDCTKPIAPAPNVADVLSFLMKHTMPAISSTDFLCPTTVESL